MAHPRSSYSSLQDAVEVTLPFSLSLQSLAEHHATHSFISQVIHENLERSAQEFRLRITLIEQ